MSTLGIVGGIGPESTIEYCRAVLAAYAERHGRAALPSIVINSVHVQQRLALMRASDLAGVADYLVVA